ncbi:helix-turn-helix domain-containing protein [Mucilaginibacter sp. SP1R1]|uniref:helix-turn-helix domain-containing protein n=1 Tax=Mucilaginibacter sp. SP1R1 TaxID=2723091 RepID=UPI00160C95DD|nr:helix-turn-helix domain-containing protein [Mucilaginibacter sp. SP1R1]MBB6151944.1 putative DNA-binding transcriptional regulator AlpA [Mucilaginibacter sp. SP1R1]
MSSNFTIQRKCAYCKQTFNAKTTVTRFCGKLCNKRFNATKQRNEKIEAEYRQPSILSAQVMQFVKNVEFLDTQKAALLLGVSRSFIYHLINTGKLVAYNLFIRRTIILKSDIERLFQSRTLAIPLSKKQVRKMPRIDDFYNMGEIHEKFKISDAAIYNLIKRNNIDKFQVGRFIYVAKKNIDSILLNQI